MKRFFLSRRCLGMLVLALLAMPPAADINRARADWPTLHRDHQRSGYTAEVLRGPFERKWYRSFVEEMIGARVEAIVAEGLCFVGTYRGNLYALDLDDGRTIWRRDLGGAIGHSPCYDGGRLFVGVDAGPGGKLVCLDARSGETVWSYPTEAGVFNAPACDGRQVYVGDRRGVFHAVSAATGERAWTYAAGYMILKPASISADKQRIVFAAEDMHVYCLSPQGELLWKSAKLPGLSLRDQAPTLWRDLVIVRTNPCRPFHESLYDARRVLSDTQRRIPLAAGERAVVDTPNMYFVNPPSPRRAAAEYEAAIAYLREDPHRRTWHTLRLEDGSEPWIAPVLYTTGLHNPPTPPTFNPETGELYTIMPTALAVYASGVGQVGIGIGRIDPQTGRLQHVAHAYPDREPGYFAGATMIADETSTLGLMGDRLLITHQGAVGQLELAAGRLATLHGRRDTYGGLFGPGAAPGSWDGSIQLARQGFVQDAVNEWHGPDCSMVSIAHSRALWVVGGCVVCFAGPDVPAAASGGSGPPPPWKWSRMPRIGGGNLTYAFGEFDASVPLRPVGGEALDRLLAPPEPSAAISSDATAARLRHELDAAVEQAIAGAPWAPWLVQLGIAKEEYHFTRSGEAMQTLALALPHLSPAVREAAVTHLDRLFASGVPIERPAAEPSGRRREHYDPSPEMLDVASRLPRPAPQAFDLYALWAYAHYADRWDRVVPQAGALLAQFDPAITAAHRFDPDGDGGYAVAQLNRDLAGAIAFYRIARRAEDAPAAEKARSRVAALAARRVHFERADSRLQSRRAHKAAIPRYEDLVPEVARLLGEEAADPLRQNLADLDRELPVWRQAWAERLLGGENYITPPRVSWGIFAANADGGAAPAQRLAALIDQPWCRADLYHLHKLTAALRQLDR